MAALGLLVSGGPSSFTDAFAAEAAHSAGADSASGVRVLLCFGVYTQWYRVEEAVRGMPGATLQIFNARNDGAGSAPAADGVSAFDAVGSAVPPAASSGGDPSVSMGAVGQRPWDVIVLGDVNRGAFPDAVWSAIATSVRQGAGLLALGGPFTYGEGKFAGCPLLEVLPIEPPTRFDLRWERRGRPFVVGATHPISDGLDLSDAPQVLWLHRARPRAEAALVLRAGSRPLLVAGVCGRGRVAAFMGTPLGSPSPNQLPFWEWRDWPRLLRQTLVWLAGGR
jgi:hypothetical protein